MNRPYRAPHNVPHQISRDNNVVGKPPPPPVKPSVYKPLKDNFTSYSGVSVAKVIALRGFLLSHNKAVFGLKATASDSKSMDYDLKSMNFDLKATPVIFRNKHGLILRMIRVSQGKIYPAGASRHAREKEKKMAKSNDWLPAIRTVILAMCRNWIAYMTADVRTAWDVPADQFTVLGTLFGNAEALLQKAMDEAERMHVITVECQAAFTAMNEKMRFFRDRYFKLPPLTEEDWAALGFRPRDTHPTPIPAPDGVPAVSLSYPGGPHVLTAHLGTLAGHAGA